MSFLNNQSYNDSRNVMTGKDGALYNGDGDLLATVESFQAQYNFTNAKYQPIGSFRETEIPQTVGVTLTFTQWVIESEDMFDDMVDLERYNTLPDWSFQGVLKNRDGSYERMIYYNCVPTGANDIQNVQVGDGIKRAYSLAVNGKVVKQQSMSKGTSKSSSVSSADVDDD